MVAPNAPAQQVDARRVGAACASAPECAWLRPGRLAAGQAVRIDVVTVRMDRTHAAA